MAFFISAETFGLASSLSAIQKMMTTILEGIPGAPAYLDDVIYCERKSRQTMTLAWTVLRALNDTGLKSNLQKCNFNHLFALPWPHLIQRRISP